MYKPLYLIWLENKNRLESCYQKYIEDKTLQELPSKKGLIEAHINKANHNLEFVDLLLKNNQFSDWIIVGLYYTIYQASLALLASKGFSSKNHDATLCFLIKHFYKEITSEELELINESYISKDEVMYYAEAKIQRKDASYSTKTRFDKQDINNLKIKTIVFVNRVKHIVENQI